MHVIIDGSGDTDKVYDRIRAFELFHDKYPEHSIHLVLPRGIPYYKSRFCDDGHVQIEHHDHPVQRSFFLLKEKSESVIVSAGNTMDVVKSAWRRAGAIHPDKALSIATEMPKLEGKFIFGDVGAHADLDIEGIIWPAILNYITAISLYHLDPLQVRIGLLNIGEEDDKGGAVLRQVFEIMRVLFGSCFVGNVEMNHALLGKKEVNALATCGLLGNSNLKSIEGGLELLKAEVRSVCSKKPWLKLQGWTFSKSGRSLTSRLRWEKFNGAYLLGVKNPTIIAHGMSNTSAFYSALERAIDPRTFALYNSITLTHPLIAEWFRIRKDLKSLRS